MLLDQNERDYFIYTLAVNFPRLVISETNSLDLSDLANKITDDLLYEIKLCSSYDWTADDTLRKDLVFHIEGLVNMDLFRNDRINPMLETIKNAFPLAFDLSLTHLEKIALSSMIYTYQKMKLDTSPCIWRELSKETAKRPSVNKRWPSFAAAARS